MNYKNINDYERLYLVRENMDDNYDILYQKYLPIIKTIAGKYAPVASQCGSEYQDLVQEGFLGLNNAIINYRDDFNTIFYTYACICIERQVSTYCRSLTSQKHQILNLSVSDQEQFYYYAKDPSDYGNFSESTSWELEKYLFQKSYCLDLDTRCVFELRFNGFSYKEIAQLLDMSKSSVDAKILKARKFLRKYLEIYNLN